MNASPARSPVLDIDVPDGAVAAVLVLHGGRERSRGAVEAHQLAVRRMGPFARAVARRSPDAAVARLRYRVRGWNGDGVDVLADVGYALGELEARLGPVPVVLLGHSLGGRAAVHAAGAPNVQGVVALAPWFPDDEPVAQLDGRSLAVLHGARDMTTSATASSRFAARAATVAREVACVRVPWSGHGMLLRARLWHRLAADYTAALVVGQSFEHPTARAVESGCTPCPVDSAQGAA